MNYEMTNKEITVEVEMISGDIKITGEDRTDIDIDFPNLRKNTVEELIDISFEENNLKIIQKSKKLSQFIDSDDLSVNIMIPKESVATARISSISGDIEISHLDDLKGVVKTKSGDLSVSDLNNFDTGISSISGDISISNVKGKIKSSTISGDMASSGSEYSKVTLKSVSGDVKLDDSFNLEDDLIVNSVSGDIEINFVNCIGEKDVVLKTVSGDVNLTGNKPAEEKIKISQVRGEFSNFNPINKEFFKGSIGSIFKNLTNQIKKVSEEVSGNKIKQEVHSSKKDNQNVQQILNMVSEGKISAEEAEKLLNALK